MDSANQRASAVAAAVTAADQKARFGDRIARATKDASFQKAQFEGQMAEAKLAAGDMQFAFQKLTHLSAERQASFDAQLALAESRSCVMKASPHKLAWSCNIATDLPVSIHVYRFVTLCRRCA